MDRAAYNHHLTSLLMFSSTVLITTAIQVNESEPKKTNMQKLKTKVGATTLKNLKDTNRRPPPPPSEILT